MIHELKVWPAYFAALLDGSKTFELRDNDRGFKVGDELDLREWSHGSGYSGHRVCRRISFVLEGPCFGLPEGKVILALQPSNRLEAV